MKTYINLNNLNKSYFAFSVIVFVLFVLFLPKEGHMGDLYCWATWAEFSTQNGLHNIYYSTTDYLPLYHYVLYVFGNIVGLEHIAQYIYYLKPITLIFHFISGFFVLQLIKDVYSPFKALLYTFLFFLLNISILYNGFIWGQVDDIFTCFAFMSFYFAYKKRVLISLLMLVIAINFKLQAIIFVPFIGLMLIPLMIKPFRIQKWVLWILSISLLQFLIILPFIFSNTVDKMWLVVIGSVGKYPIISGNAFNFWEMFHLKSFAHQKDTNLFLFLSYKRWGLLFFFIFSGITLFKLIKNDFNQLVNKTKETLSLDVLLIIGALIPLLFFFFNTQMHERYSHATLVFVMAYSIRRKEILIPSVILLAYFLNLHLVFYCYEYKNELFYKVLRKFVSVLFLTGIVLLYFRLYKLPNNNQFLSK